MQLNILGEKKKETKEQELCCYRNLKNKMKKTNKQTNKQHSTNCEVILKNNKNH